MLHEFPTHRDVRHRGFVEALCREEIFGGL
jgi:hypothetical protein